MAASIAIAARRTRSLSPSGAAAAVVAGSAAVAAGWGWGVLLVAFFVSSSLLGRVRRAERERRTAGIVARGEERDAVQVFANGGLFTAAAVGQAIWPHPAWMALGVGALAAAAADSWATGVGTLARRPPRMLPWLRPVPHGTSGAVSAPGLAATLAGAAFVAAVAWAAGWPQRTAAAALVGGVAGSIADSIFGATIQARRRCPACRTGTERIVHDCGERTLPAGGMSWADNDVVNVLATIVGAGVTLAVASLGRTAGA